MEEEVARTRPNARMTRSDKNQLKNTHHMTRLTLIGIDYVSIAELAERYEFNRFGINESFSLPSLARQDVNA